jgi:hypothetical protein
VFFRTGHSAPIGEVPLQLGRGSGAELLATSSGPWLVVERHPGVVLGDKREPDSLSLQAITLTPESSRTLQTWRDRSVLVFARSWQGPVRALPVWAPSQSWAGNGGRFASADGDEYQVEIRTLADGLVRRNSMQVARIAFPRDAHVKWREGWLAGYPDASAEQRARADSLFAGRRVPVIGSVRLAPDGSVMVLRRDLSPIAAAEGDSATHDWWGPDGVIRGYVKLPMGDVVQGVGASHLFVVRQVPGRPSGPRGEDSRPIPERLVIRFRVGER